MSDYGDAGLTIDSRLVQRCSRILCVVPGTVSTLGCWDGIRTDFNKLRYPVRNRDLPYSITLGEQSVHLNLLYHKPDWVTLTRDFRL